MNERIIPPPQVRRHPEILDILKRVNRAELSSSEAFGALSKIVQEYLFCGSAEGHGELVGGAIYGALVLNKPGTLEEADARIWNELQHEPASPNAAARGVLFISVLFVLPLDDSEVSDGAYRLYKEHMTKMFPPSPYLFKTEFSVLRKYRPIELEL